MSFCVLAATLFMSCASHRPPVVVNDLRAAERVVVSTTYGPIAGYADNGISMFLGIPYARPPVGDLRFAPPKEPERWTNIFPAVSYGPVAPQHLDETEPASSFWQSEDCLSLNVWTPAADSKRRPVIFYIHGGGFLLGGTADPSYNGEEFARRGDVVFVSANYRLGVFGFLYLDNKGDEFRGSGNLGLMDQIAALKWIKENISRFGGDPGNVTIMGESAGGISVGMLMSIPSAKGLFHKAIAQSGAPDTNRTREEGERFTKVFMETAGVTDVPGLRKLTVAAMVDAQKRFIAKYGLEADMLFSPVIDGALIPKDPYEAIREGSAAGIPLLHGTTKDEFRYWLQYEPMMKFITPGMLISMAPNFSRRIGNSRDRIIDHYKAEYPKMASGDLSMQLATDMAFWVPHIHLAEAQAAHAKTWMYMFSVPSQKDGGFYGADHGVELPYVFYMMTVPWAAERVGTPPPLDFARSVQDAWIAFARTGVPAAKGLPEWPAYDMQKRSTMILDLKSTVVSDPKKADRELFRGILY
jgi:para-nitrobenzyl esterase